MCHIPLITHWIINNHYLNYNETICHDVNYKIKKTITEKHWLEKKGAFSQRYF